MKNQNARIALRLPFLMVKRLKEDAKQAGVSLSEIIRRIIQKYYGE